MEWNEFKESEKEYPEDIVAKTIDGFSKATSHLCEIQISPVESFVGDLFVDFEFRVLLLSNTIKSYKFEVFRFGYNVDLFPVFSIIDENIFEELTKKKMRRKQKTIQSNEKEFQEFLNGIFGTSRFKEVVSGLMKISRKHLTE
ncbi:hypothetical protein Q4553_13150 [Tenacibaculum soleae]|uniref:hypothetical protein n=1 Tax=Tenacibaculum soleae TaxID=447689 RepID=UPI0026E242E7|nr:hypothetical protein [Tenacibaculum soleae]MDO6745515.1 hypothetical protein [Tenacibaculum soleae]